jgi:aspartate aminotransferase-like enzyme
VEAAPPETLAPERVLAIVSGAFSERWAACARDLGIAVDVLESPWGAPVDPGDVRRALGKARYEAVTVVHSETLDRDASTTSRRIAPRRARGIGGVRAGRRRDLGGRLARRVRRLESRLRLSGSQKALALPPGLGVAFASVRFRARRPRALAGALPAARGARKPSRRNTRRPTRRPTPHLFALDVQLDHILTETIEGRWARHDALRRRVRVVGARSRPHRTRRPRAPGSWTVSCLKPRAGVSPEALVAKAKERGFTIGGGYGNGRPRRSASATWATWTWLARHLLGLTALVSCLALAPLRAAGEAA